RGVSGRGEPSCQDFSDFVRGQVAVLVGEADATVELRVASEALLNPGHPDEDDAHVVMVEVVANLLKAGGLEAVSFIDDEQLGAPAGAGLGMDVGVHDAMFGEIHGK